MDSQDTTALPGQVDPRYPYTHAYDFIRGHVGDFSPVHGMRLPTVSRSQCAQMCHAIAPALGLTPEDLAKKIADHAAGKSCAASDTGEALDAARWRRLVNASELPFPVATIADDPENDCILIYGRKRLEELIDGYDEISDAARSISSGGTA